MVGHKLAAAFYARVEHDPVLRPLYGPSGHYRCAIENLGAFLNQFLAGTTEYSERRWSLSLREAHLRFKIGPREREAWLLNMREALKTIDLDAPSRRALDSFFKEYSAQLVNTERLAVEPASIDHELGARWNGLRAVEEAVAAIRNGDADAALALIDGPVLQAHFKRDLAALQSLLALMSVSGHAGLLDYVVRELRRNPAPVRERYYFGRTLLHDVAARGSLPITALLLELGADPGALDHYGHTPLYCVANACTAARANAIVRVLVSTGADPNIHDNVKRCTALHMAARRGNVPVAEALLDGGADLEARDRAGDTPLRRAVNCGKPAMVAFLLSRGAKVDSKGNRGLTPIQAARTPAVKALFRS